MIQRNQEQQSEVDDPHMKQMIYLLEKASDREREEFLLSAKPEYLEGKLIASYASAIKTKAKLKNIPNSLDIVGTGGDGLNTINVSTAASIIVSGLGYPVVKHGNFGSTNHKGSADFLKFYGYNFQFTMEELMRRVRKLNFAFILAPLYNESFAVFALARKNVARKTVFNYLGPITNPADPDTVVLGAADEKIQEIYADFMIASRKQGFSIHSTDGMDEISPAEPSTLIQVSGNEKHKLTLYPEDITGETVTIDQVTESDPERSFRKTLDGISGRDRGCAVFIALNASVAMAAATGNIQFQHNYEKALRFIMDGEALKHFRRITSNAV